MTTPWAISTLGKVCEWITQGPNPKYDKSGQDEFRVLKTKDLYDDVIHYDSADRISKNVFSQHLRTELETGDVLIAIVGQGSINKCNVFEKREGVRFIFTRALGLLRPNRQYLDSYFLKYFLQSSAGKELIDSGIAGTSGQQVVTTTHLKSLQISVPPPSEQHRIVGILDEAFDGLACATANAEQNLRNARALFESHLQSVFMNKMWKMSALGDLCTGVEYGSSAKSKNEGKIPVLRMGNIQDGRFDWGDLVYTDDEAEIVRYQLEHNDVLFNRTNSPELVGKTAIYKSERPAIFAGYLIRIRRRKELLDADYLNYFLNSRIAFDYGKTVVISSVNQANINGTKLKTYPIPTPSLAEQKDIVAELDALVAETQRLESIYQQKLAALAELKKSLLHQAFSGKL